MKFVRSWEDFDEAIQFKIFALALHMPCLQRTNLTMSKLLLFAWLGYIWHANSPFPNPKHSLPYLNKNLASAENSFQDKRLKNLSANNHSNTYAIFSVAVNVLLWSLTSIINLMLYNHLIIQIHYLKLKIQCLLVHTLQTQW
jgi:hypothetical protein